LGKRWDYKIWDNLVWGYLPVKRIRALANTNIRVLFPRFRDFSALLARDGRFYAQIPAVAAGIPADGARNLYLLLLL